MKNTLFTLFAIMYCWAANAQTPDCNSHLDSAKAMKIAAKNHALWGIDSGTPQITFNDQNCEWTVYSFTSHHSNMGSCRHTNGCTVINSVTLVIDAQTEEVKSKKKERKRIHNYE